MLSRLFGWAAPLLLLGLGPFTFAAARPGSVLSAEVVFLNLEQDRPQPLLSFPMPSPAPFGVADARLPVTWNPTTQQVTIYLQNAPAPATAATARVTYRRGSSFTAELWLPDTEFWPGQRGDIVPVTYDAKQHTLTFHANPR